jgi:hypothetical protein
MTGIDIGDMVRRMRARVAQSLQIAPITSLNFDDLFEKPVSPPFPIMP